MSILITCVSPANSMRRSLSKINSTILPAGTPFPVQIEDHLPVRIGQTVRTQLLYSVYANDILALPANAVISGTVTALRSNHSRCISAQLHGDFTPFDMPVVRFTEIPLLDGFDSSHHNRLCQRRN